MEGHFTMKSRSLLMFVLGLCLTHLPTGLNAQDRNSRLRNFGDSVETGTPQAEPIRLGLLDAIQRGLRNNLAVISGNNDARIAEATRMRDLAELLPKVTGQVAAMQEQVNLAAFGFGGFPGIGQVNGPFALFDARAYFSQTLVDMQKVHNLRESRENEKAVAFSNQNNREFVVLSVIELYFEAVSSASRVEATEAQVTSAEALSKRAADLKSSGLVPGIDVLRADVELQAVRQRQIQARNDLSRQKLNLARAIGLPLAQEFTLSDSLPGGATPAIRMEESLSAAYANRADARAADARMRAAKEAVLGAQSQNLPTVKVDANYGANGRQPGNTHGSYTVAGTVQFPIFNAKTRSDISEKEALLHQRQAEIDSLHGRIELEVRSAVLELQSSEEQYKAAQSGLNLVRQQLTQAQDRFAAGIANNLEVVQAQEALAVADENLIRSLYSLNAARAAFAHAMGTTEQAVEQTFGGGRKP